MRFHDVEKLDRQVCKVTDELWKHFAPEEPYESVEESRIRLACWIMEETIEFLLLKGVSLNDIENYLWAVVCDLDGAKELKDYIEDKVRVDKAKRGAEIRSDFASALRGVRKGTDLSYDLGFGFSSADIANLARLHKSNKFRKKIEDLLEDCNFHRECGDFSEGNYEKYLGGVA